MHTTLLITRVRRVLLAAVAIGATTSLASRAGAADFTYTLLDVPGAGSTFAYGIEGATVVGCYYDTNNVSHGFQYYQGTYTPIDVPAVMGTNTQVFDISGSTMVGCYMKDNLAHGFMWDGAEFTTIDHPNAGTKFVYGTCAYGISGGTASGFYYDNQGHSHGFTLSDGRYTTLDNPNAIYGNTVVYGISGSTTVGAFQDATGMHSFRETDGVYTTLAVDAALHTNNMAYGISGSSVVGCYYNESSIFLGGFIETDGAYSSIDGLQPWGIDGTTIVGCLDDSTGTHGFMASIPEPTSLALLGMGTASLLRRRRRVVNRNP